MKRNLIALLLALALCTALMIPAFASDGVQRANDGAALLTAEEQQTLNETLYELSTGLDYDIVVLTVDSLNGWTPEQYARSFYLQNGYRADGTILLLSMEERDWFVANFGFGTYCMTDYLIDFVMNTIIGDISAGNYYAAFTDFAELTASIVEDALTDYYNEQAARADRGPVSPLTAFVSLIVGLISALTGTSVMKGKLKSVRGKTEAASYVRSGSMEVTTAREVFLYRNVVRTPRSTGTNNRGSSGGGARPTGSSTGHGGKF